MNKKLSILVVTFNRMDWLKKNLDSIFTQKGEVENIYIVSNNSTDGIKEYLKELKEKSENLIIIDLKENIGGVGGFYKGIKKFLKTSRYEDKWLSLIDDDCILDENFSLEILNGDINLNNLYVSFVYKIENKQLNSNFLKRLIKINEIEYKQDDFSFRGMNLEKIREKVNDNYYFDLRNVHVKDIKVRELFKYYPVGQE